MGGGDTEQRVNQTQELSWLFVGAGGSAAPHPCTKQISSRGEAGGGGLEPFTASHQWVALG